MLYHIQDPIPDATCLGLKYYILTLTPHGQPPQLIGQ